MLTTVSANFLSPKACVRAHASGWGSYATEPIAAGETVAAFGGRCVSRSVLDTLDDGSAAHAVQIDDDLFMVSPLTSVPDVTKRLATELVTNDKVAFLAGFGN